MIHAYHVIFGCYGFWLPNDPRGSWSKFVASWEVRRFGTATKVTGRRSVAATGCDHGSRLAAKTVMHHPAVKLTGLQARAVARGFDRALTESQYQCYACSILPEHVHLVVAPHAQPMEQMVRHLKSRATRQLIEECLHPLAKTGAEPPPSPWARGLWKVFLNDPAAVRNAIRYVEHNPVKERKPPQRWKFVVPYA